MIGPIEEDNLKAIDIMCMGGGLPSEYANTNVDVINSIFNKIKDETYHIAQNSFEKTALKIQTLLVSKKIVSPVIETTDLVATGSSRLSKLHTNSIVTDGDSIEIDLDEENSGFCREFDEMIY